MTDDIDALRAEITQLRLLLIRKNEALAIFADPRFWRAYPSAGLAFWISGHSDPAAFARREMEATEPCE